MIDRERETGSSKRHRPVAGRVWIAVGAVLVVAVTIAGFIARGSSTIAAVVVVTSAITAGAARRALHRGRRLSAPPASAVLAPSDRDALSAVSSGHVESDDLSTTDALGRPVVYLRSFEHDETRYVPTLFSRRHRRVWPRWFFVFGAGVWLPKTHEERLAQALQTVGPFVAIGDPRDRLPDLGAARVYVDDGDWQGTILALIDRAALVVVETEASEGLIWEAQQVVDRVPAERLILSIPVTEGARPRPDRYEAFRQRTLGIFPQPLPEEIGDAQFIVFDTNWSPTTFAPTREPSKHELESPSRQTPQQLALRRLQQEFRLHTRRFVLRLVPYGIALCLAVAVVVALAIDGGGRSAADGSPVSVREASWVRIGQAFGFSVLLPGRATESIQRTPVQYAGHREVVITHTFAFGPRGAWFQAAYSRLPADLIAATQPQVVLREVSRARVEGDRPRQLTTRHLSSAVPGYAYRAELTNGALIEGMAYLRGRSLYEVAATHRPGTVQSARVQRFLRSFRLTR